MIGSAAPRVAHNRFPVLVQRPDGTTLRDARVAITCPDGGQPARLFVWTVRGDPAELAAVDLEASTIGRPRQTWDLVTDLGSYRVLPGRGCGCSNPLKSWEPWAPMLMGSPRCLEGAS